MLLVDVHNNKSMVYQIKIKYVSTYCCLLVGVSCQARDSAVGHRRNWSLLWPMKSVYKTSVHLLSLALGQDRVLQPMLDCYLLKKCIRAATSLIPLLFDYSHFIYMYLKMWLQHGAMLVDSHSVYVDELLRPKIKCFKDCQPTICHW